MIEAGLIGQMLEISSELKDDSFDVSRDSVFVEDRLTDSTETWNGNEFDISKEKSGFHSDEIQSESISDFKEDLNWSTDIIESIRTAEEADVYIDANLQEGIVNQKVCLQNPEINWEQRTPIILKSDIETFSKGELPIGFGRLDSIFSMSNKERALQGMPPLDCNGHAYELHHIGQRMDSPLAELTFEQHHTNGNYKRLHTFDESKIDRNDFGKERMNYWKARAEML